MPAALAPTAVDPAALAAVARAGYTCAPRWDACVRAAARASAVVIAPVGDGNGKTACPGTYRSIADSCPPAGDGPGRCPYRDRGCLAQGGRVAPAERRAPPGEAPALLAAAACLARARRIGCLVRLHVSGDLGSDRASAERYLSALVDIGGATMSILGIRPARRPALWAWGYTHADVDADTLARARAHGIMLRRSDYAGPWGAVVGSPGDRALRAQIRAAGAVPVACPEQVTHGRVTCMDCGICWRAPRACVIFAPSLGSAGGRAAMLTRAAGALATATATAGD